MHVAIRPADEVTIQEGAVVSRIVHRDDDLEVTVFGFAKGEGLTEHRASRAAIVQVLSGRLRLTVDGEVLELVPGHWLHLSLGAPHSLVAVEPTTMLLELVKP